MEDITVVVDGEYLIFTNNFENDCKIDVYYGYESSNSKQGKRFLFSMTEEQMIIAKFMKNVATRSLNLA